MTVEDVKAKVAAIRKIAEEDYEIAHSMEDALYRDVLTEISMGRHDADDLASEALQTKNIDFARYCALRTTLSARH